MEQLIKRRLLNYLPTERSAYLQAIEDLIEVVSFDPRRDDDKKYLEEGAFAYCLTKCYSDEPDHVQKWLESSNAKNLRRAYRAGAGLMYGRVIKILQNLSRL